MNQHEVGTDLRRLLDGSLAGINGSDHLRNISRILDLEAVQCIRPVGHLADAEVRIQVIDDLRELDWHSIWCAAGQVSSRGREMTLIEQHYNI